jgi:hypothetical protein
VNKLIVAVDFNGVIHDHRDGVRGMCLPSDAEIFGAIEWLRQISGEFDVFLVSASFGDSRFIVAAKAWLEVKGIPRQWMVPALAGRSRITLTPFKPVCLMFVDDRGFCFRGEFPTADEIKSFKPWNR